MFTQAPRRKATGLERCERRAVRTTWASGTTTPTWLSVPWAMKMSSGAPSGNRSCRAARRLEFTGTGQAPCRPSHPGSRVKNLQQGLACSSYGAHFVWLSASVAMTRA